MRGSLIAEFLERQMKAERYRPIFIWAPPGVGKSATVKGVATKLKIGLRDVRLPLLDPTDIRGIPFPELATGKARWLAPEFMPDPKRDGPKGILFLDELNAAPPLVQASAYQLVLDRQVGDYRLPDGWLIVAAGNRAGDRAVVHRMPSALTSRFVHVDYGGFGDGANRDDLEDWTEWAINRKLDHRIIGFLQFMPEALFNFKPDKDERSFACPRTWEYTHDLMDLPANIFEEALVGTIGQGAATAFRGFLNVYGRLPDINKILAGGFEIPTKKDVLYATITSLAVKAEEKHVNHLVEWSAKMPEETPEFAVLLIKLMRPRYGKQIVSAPAFASSWVKKFHEVLIIS